MYLLASLPGECLVVRCAGLLNAGQCRVLGTMALNLLKRNPMSRKQSLLVDTLYQFGSPIRADGVSKGFIVPTAFFRGGIHVNRTVRRSLPQVGYVHANL